MKDVCSPINKRTTAGSPPSKLIKVPHAPVYGPPATGGGRDAGSSSPAISGVISVTRGRNLTDPDPFPPPDRAA
jgi:hypothetical protein